MNADIYTEPQHELNIKLLGPIIGYVHEQVPIGTHKYPFYATKDDPAFPHTILCLQEVLGDALWIRWPKSYLHPK